MNDRAKITHRCCDAFERATERGTDNEGWASLLWVDETEAGVQIGDGLPPIRFCPWCGAPVDEVDPK